MIASGVTDLRIETAGTSGSGRCLKFASEFGEGGIVARNQRAEVGAGHAVLADVGRHDRGSQLKKWTFSSLCCGAQIKHQCNTDFYQSATDFRSFVERFTQDSALYSNRSGFSGCHGWHGSDELPNRQIRNIHVWLLRRERQDDLRQPFFVLGLPLSIKCSQQIDIVPCSTKIDIDMSELRGS
jgi:hypothetical protein